MRVGKEIADELKAAGVSKVMLACVRYCVCAETSDVDGLVWIFLVLRPKLGWLAR